jgi:PEP-CTERM motif
MKLLVTFVAVIWTLSTHAQGLIWSVNLTSIGGNGAGAGPVPNREVGLDHLSTPSSPTPPSLNPVTGIFAMTISTNDSGRTFFANALNSSGFYGFASGLTDGANHYIRIQEYSPLSGWGSATESGFLGRSPAAPDFAGYTITQIGFRVNNYYDWFYEPENRYLNTLDYSLDFYGSPVPEPGTWALLSLGGAAALLLRRKARRRR